MYSNFIAYIMDLWTSLFTDITLNPWECLFNNLIIVHSMRMTIIIGWVSQISKLPETQQATYKYHYSNEQADRIIDCSETYKRRLQWSFLNFPFHWRHKPKIKENAHKYIMSRNEKWHVGRACCKLYAFINGATFSLLDFCL